MSVFLSPTVLRTEGDLQVDHLYVCVWFLTTLLLVDTTDTGFSLVDFNEVFEIVLLVWPVQDLWAGFILYTSN